MSALTARHRIGAAMWLARLAYFVAEVAVAVASTAPYSFVTNTISDLGASTCTSIERFGAPVPVCSPAHGLMNGSFVVFGALMALGAVLLFGRFGRGPLAVALVALLVVSGASSIAVGLTPLDLHPDGHVLAATPLFIAQPAALVVLGLLLRDRPGRLGLGLIVTGVVCAVAALAFIQVNHLIGITERIALWPVFVALAIVGAAELRAERPHRA